MSSDRRVTVQVTRAFTASAERVFDAWLDPAKASRFLFATAAGTMVRAEIDPRVGGRFVFVDRRDGTDVSHAGEYLEIDRPRRLVFQFSVSGYETEVTRVAIDIAPDGDGCTLTLTHEGVPEPVVERDEHGWRAILDGLASSLA